MGGCDDNGIKGLTHASGADARARADATGWTRA